MFEIQDIPDTSGCGWVVKIDGTVRRVQRIELGSTFGTLIYGRRPEGYDSWVFYEQGGGGAVTLLYAYTPYDELIVGLLLEKRANMGDVPVWCAIGGFIDPCETHELAQVREADEEAGLGSLRVKEFTGMRTNSNRAFFVADASEGEGVHAYGMEVPFEWLTPDGKTFRFQDTNHFNHKKASAVRFFPWREAINRSPDALARSAIAQLLAAVM
ncbi:MAG: hypothetical protein UX10_C0001G0026 [Candidatus Magasanikbacteria bacterium GW2011_GWA2_45_39]|uniref:Nudix hydrolase domain-containing protein n=2 Tax=Candidatus Magasanikiibacteriota TaxID=1752731 RepID=A0A0G1R058_9BACT|nr:MAG: hypothetical protein UX10_C0001G0026 [Candidatus Magasanikbacteria bacterium GW2011_GWA2_45_39]KKU14285.1 MAG: hypothetical protein UX20_C0002G0022 [Candidatus Magasanikbacteria bacterium GW2011_GWC2_45_8]HBW73989.1 hypothetical protein [Candidatus Magasanikbacteria bacterium]